MLAAAGIPSERRVLLCSADVRYRRQAYELTVPLTAGPMTRASLDALATNFHEKHHQTYGHATAMEPVQLVTLRLTAVGRSPNCSWGSFPQRQHLLATGCAKSGFPRLALPLPPCIGAMS